IPHAGLVMGQQPCILATPKLSDKGNPMFWRTRLTRVIIGQVTRSAATGFRPATPDPIVRASWARLVAAGNVNDAFPSLVQLETVHHRYRRGRRRIEPRRPFR